jgi:hypothetical protein
VPAEVGSRASVGFECNCIEVGRTRICESDYRRDLVRVLLLLENGRVDQVTLNDHGGLNLQLRATLCGCTRLSRGQ